MQIFNKHEQAEFTKINGHVSPIVYRIERLWTKGHATLIFASYRASPGAGVVRLPIKTP